VRPSLIATALGSYGYLPGRARDSAAPGTAAREQRHHGEHGVVPVALGTAFDMKVEWPQDDPGISSPRSRSSRR